MTRREEIEKQAEITVFPWDEPQEQNKFQDGFIEGAKWADKTMIDKACEWLKEVFVYMSNESSWNIQTNDYNSFQ